MHKRIALVAFLAVPIGPLARLLSTDPCELQAELTPSVLEGGDQAGWSVASEGSRLVLGSPQHSDKGGVFIYSFDGSSWDLDSTIIPNQLDVGDQFGFSISLSGGLLAVSAIGDDTIAPDAGAVYIFEEISSTQWAIQQTLYPTVPGFQFGDSVSLWDDTIAVGEPETERVYVFRQSGQDWVEEGDEDGPPFDSPGIPGLTVIGSSFGEAVAVYQDTLLVGDDDLTISTPPNTQKVGRAYIFKRTGSSWELALNVANPAATSDAEHFGESVGLHGRWAVIGAPQFDVGDQPAQGAVHLYRTNSAGEYELHSMLTASDGSAGNKFGLSVAIRSGILLIGAPHKGAFEYGAAYQYNYVDGSWLETGILDADDQMLIDQIPNERLGTSVAVGTYAGIGGPGSTSSIPGRALVWSLCE